MAVSVDMIQLRVNGKVVETRPYTQMTVSMMEGLGKLDPKHEYYEMNQGIFILKSSLVNKDDWELFSDMSIPEFSEILSEWMELQSGTSLE
jgi:hypothetical protein